ncbi:MAG TPA: hypothetical protein VFE78_19470, partial [Gemmataceae bacterium]|nr:hypothetical protein [Gemmataceae bacterium]
MHGVCFSPDGRRLASVAGRSFHEGELIVWDAVSGARVYEKLDYKSELRTVAYSPDGKLLALGHGYSDPTIRLLDAATAKELREMKGHAYAIDDLTFDPDGKRLASAGSDKTVRLWDVKDGRLLETFRDHTNYIYSVCFSPDGKRLYSAGSDYRVRGRDLSRGGEKLFPHTGHQDRVNHLAVSLDGRRLTSASADKTWLEWDLTTGKEVGRLPAPAASAILAIAPGGLLLAGPTGSDTVAVWDGRTGTRLREWKAGNVRVAEFSPDAGRLACWVREKDRVAIDVWDVRDGRRVGSLARFEGDLGGFRFLPGGTRLAVSAGKRGEQVVREWDVETGKPIRPLASLKYYDFHGLSPDGRRLLSRSGLGTNLFKVQAIPARGKEEAPLNLARSPRGFGRSKTVVPGGWSPDGRFLAGGTSGSVVVWDGDTGKVHREVSLNAPIRQVVFAPDGRHLIAGSVAGTLYVLRLTASAASAPNGKSPEPAAAPLKAASPVIDEALRRIAASRAAPAGPWRGPSPLDRLRREDVPAAERAWHGSPPELVGVIGELPLRHGDRYVFGASYSPDGTRLATHGDDKEHAVNVWDTTTHKLLFTLKGSVGSLGSTCFSPDGKLIATNRWADVVLWDARTGGKLRELKGIGGVTSYCRLCFSPDNKRLAAACQYRREREHVIVWDLATDKNFRVSHSPGEARDVCFSPDGKLLATAGDKGDEGGEVLFWDPASGQGRPRQAPKAKFKAGVSCVAFSPDGNLLAAGGRVGDGTVKLFEAATGKAIRVFSFDSTFGVDHLAFDRTGRYLVSSGHLGRVQLWDVKTGALLQSLSIDDNGSGTRIGGLRFLPNSGRLAWVAPASGRFLELTEDNGLVAPDGHLGPVLALAVSLDGKHLTSAGRDQTLRTWGLATRRAEVSRLALPIEPARPWSHTPAAVFGPGGLLLFC